MSGGVEGARRSRRVRGGCAVVVLASMVLAGCGGSPITPGNLSLQNVFRGSTQPTEQPDIGPDLVALCPAVTINPGTESLRRDGGNDSDQTLRFQASINNTARECTEADGGIAVRVGVSGRVVEGSAGAPEKVELPIRVAVQEGGEVTYSRLHAVEVTMDAVSKSWAFVDESVFISVPRGARIVVGFDG